MWRTPKGLKFILVVAWGVSCSKGPSAQQTVPSPTASAPASAPQSAAASSQAAPPSHRPKVPCAQLLMAMERGGGNSSRVSTKTTAGSWGRVPEELRVLPPGAEHCGSIAVMDQAVVASDLEGEALEKFYAPLFAKIGCEPLKCETATNGGLVQTRCRCEKALYLHGAVNTDPSSQSYTLGVKDMRLK